jgi:hypothetical protein
MTEHQPILYEPAERPDVEVWVDDGAGGTWWPGEVRMVSFTGTGETLHNVQYRTDAGQFVETFPDDHVRADTIDRSRSR